MCLIHIHIIKIQFVSVCHTLFLIIDSQLAIRRYTDLEYDIVNNM